MLALPTRRVSRAPKTWNGDAANDIFVSLKFRDIELSEKIWRGQTTDCLVRGIAPGSDHVSQPFFEDDDGEVVELLIAKESMRRQSKHRSQPLRNEFRFTLPSDQQPRKHVHGEDPFAVPVGMPAVPPMKRPSEIAVPEESDKEMDDTSVGQKRPQTCCQDH